MLLPNYSNTIKYRTGWGLNVSVSAFSEERSSENQHLSTSSQMKDGEELGLLEENSNYQGKHWMVYAGTLPQRTL